MSDLENTSEDSAVDNAAELAASELDSLKAKADLVGVKYHPSISADKLRAKVAAHIAGEPEPGKEAVAETKVAAVETVLQKRKRTKDTALALVRVNVTCMNPAKREWDGEIFAVGNSHIATQKKFVPFNTADGYHIPKIMFDMLKERKCQVFYNERAKNGITVRKGKLINEFAIEVLPQLTEKELAELAKIQAVAGTIE